MGALGQPEALGFTQLRTVLLAYPEYHDCLKRDRLRFAEALSSTVGALDLGRSTTPQAGERPRRLRAVHRHGSAADLRVWNTNLKTRNPKAGHHFLLRDPSQEPWPHRDSGDEIQYLLRAEEQILQSISGRAPLPKILRKICQALDLEMGNMVSLFSLPSDDATSLAAIARSARVFSMHKFCSARVAGGNDESLGSLEMYCCLPRRPFLPEVRLIERATCLAAVAIKRHNDFTT